MTSATLRSGGSVILFLACLALASGDPPASPASSSSSAPPAAAAAQPTKTAPRPAAKASPAPGRVVKKRAAAKAAPPKAPWDQFPLDPHTTITLDFRNANIDVVLRMLTEASGIPVIKDPALKCTINLTSVKSATLSDTFALFDAVLRLQKYQLVKGAKWLAVEPIPPPAPPVMMPPPKVDNAPTLETYRIKYADATTLARAINDAFATPPQHDEGPSLPGLAGANAQKPAAVKASAEDYSNTLIVFAPKKQQEQIAKLIASTDVAADIIRKSRVYHLTYATAEDVEPVVEEIVSANATLGRGGETSVANKQDNNRFIYFYDQPPPKDKSNGTVMANDRTNAIIVTATEEVLSQVADVIAMLDKPADYQATTWIYKMKFARVDVVANLLGQALGNRTTGGAFGGSLSGNTITTSSNNSSGSSPNLSTTTNRSNNSNTNYGNSGPLAIGSTAMDRDQKVTNVESLLNRVILVPNVDTNSIIVTSSPDDKPTLEELLDELDVKPQQVSIETLIVEAELNKNSQYGVEISGVMGKLFGNSRGSGAGGTSTIDAQSGTFAQGGLSYTLNLGEYRTIVQAMREDSSYKVLSTPRIFTTNNASGQLNISQAVPYQTGSTTDTTGNISYSYGYLNVGIILTVTPHITSNGYVTMDIDQSANELQGYNTTLNAPIVNQREATTTASVKDGETIVLGGIISNNLTDTMFKVPILGDVPILGNLFRSRSKENSHTELLVFLTPHVVNSPDDAQKIRKDTESEYGATIHEMTPRPAPIAGQAAPAGAAAPPAPAPPSATPPGAAPAQPAPPPPAAPPTVSASAG